MPPPTPTRAQPAIAKSLSGLGTGVKGRLTVTGLVDRTKTSATANYDATWTLPGLTTPWKYSGTVPVVKSDKTWLVDWKITDVQPDLDAANHLLVKRTQPTRAALTDDKGAPLVARTPVVTVGINPADVTDLTSLAASLAAVPELEATAADITGAVKAAGKNQFVPLITLRQPVYESIRARIHDLPGTQFQPGEQLLPPRSGFARDYLGTVGDATKELIDGSGGKIAAGDQVGTSGLQLALDAQLRGTPGVAVYEAKDADESVGRKLATVSAPVAGKPVQLTLDTATQEAADAVLADESLPAAIVVTQPSTGRVLAVANSASAPGDIALTGQYPAGSTFKIVTYTADFTANPSHTPETQTTCPPTVNVDGRSFENENKFHYDSVTYSAAFGYSCNTTAINVADALPNGTMFKAAQALGLGADWKLPIDAFSGSMPSTATGTEKAAEAIGQGKVLVSPLLMAGIVGASATGKPIAPSVLVGQPGAAGKPLDPALTAKMNTAHAGNRHDARRDRLRLAQRRCRVTSGARPARPSSAPTSHRRATPGSPASAAIWPSRSSSTAANSRPPAPSCWPRTSSPRCRRVDYRGVMSTEVHDSPASWVNEHIQKYIETDGAEGHIWQGVPTLLLTTKGRKSGELRRTALIYGVQNGAYMVVASQGGAPNASGLVPQPA